MMIRSRAPLRISFAGGGTDVEPYPQERGGTVLSATIDKYAYATLIPRRNGQIRVESLDYDVVAKYNVDEKLPYDGELDLVKAVVRTLGYGEGMELFLHTDAPPGSGLGASSTVVVALIGAFLHWQGRSLGDYEIAQLAYQIERVELGVQGGWQDQFAATFGGFNFIEFLGKETVVNPLRIKRATLDELHYRLLLCYTGRTRLSARILDRQIDGYVRKREEVVAALDEIKALTLAAKNALLKGRLDEFGRLLHQGWQHKQRLADGISNPEIEALYQAGRQAGAIGGKLLGAGGGGYLLLLCPFERKHRIAQALEEAGGQVVPFNFDLRGLQTWQVDEESNAH
ncbi:MAG: GHMP kinase [Chloroflexia bacterium]|nr:GHMP kinase [Chloroflexia bacterium]